MSTNIGVLSKVPHLMKHLRGLLPSVTFVELTLPKDIPHLGTSEILIADLDLLAPYLSNLKQTKWVQSTWAGLDAAWPHVDRQNPPSFTLTRFSGTFFGEIMSQYVLAQILNFERGFFAYHDRQKDQVWDQSMPKFRSLSELSVGVMGVGSIGYKICADLKALGAVVYGYGRSERKDLEYLAGYYTKARLNDFLKKVDYIVNVMPTTNETKGLLNNGVLKNCCERQAVLINIGRGTVVDESELIEALEKQWLRGAILDVFQTEPLPKQSKLWRMSQVHVTPHIAGPTVAKAVAELFRDNYQLYTELKALPLTVDWKREY